MRFPPRTVEASTMRIEMSEKRKKYDREFREGAVRIVGPELSQFSDPGFSRLLLWCRGYVGLGGDGLTGDLDGDLA